MSCAGLIKNVYLTPNPTSEDGLIKLGGSGMVPTLIVAGFDVGSSGKGTIRLPRDRLQCWGVEFAGHVIAVGSEASRWKINDEVMGLAGGGAYAEYIVVPQTHVVPKPARLSWVEAASILECFLTAFQAMIVYGEVKPNDNVLVHAGASGVGIAAIQLARFSGAKTVIATASTQGKLDWLLSLPNGATHAVNYKTQDFSAEVEKITEKKRVDVVIDFVGRTHFQKNLASLAVDGRMTMLAFLSGPTVASVDLPPILFKRLRLQGSTLRSRTPQYQADLIARFDKEILQHITGEKGDGPIKTYIHKVYPWTQIQDAHREMESNSNSGQIIAEIVDERAQPAV
ncbi:hypothetical protein DFH06DRAFT_1317176 [Mycena polygramma]|nr:hypothetical protein DFH06DRAFT_1317176 [Mycena polygramma]